MFERRKEKPKEPAVDEVRETARRDLETERERLEKEREAIERERERLERLQEEIEAREEHLEEIEGQLEDLEDTIEEQEEELEDAESVGEILDVVTERIPNLLAGIQSAIISPEQSKQMAQSIAEFYKTLIDAGMSEGSANTLTLTHMSNLQHTAMHSARRLRIPDLRGLRDLKDLKNLADLGSAGDRERTSDA